MTGAAAATTAAPIIAGGEALLRLDDVHTYYGHIHALQGITIEVRRGEIVTLIGANGAGKTTTLKTISGLLHPRAGRVTFEGADISHTPAHKLVRSGIGHAPEGRRIFSRLTVLENLQMGAFTRDQKTIGPDLERVFTLFPRLQERIAQQGGTLSGGEQQMLALARGLATRPALLLLDELSMGLAPLIVEELFTQVAAIAATGVSIVVVEQFAHAVLAVADLAAVLVQGRLGALGSPHDIEAQLSAAYLGAAHSPVTT